MHYRHTVSLFAALVVQSACGAQAVQPPPLNREPVKTTLPPRTMFLGRITRLSDDGVEIRPWDARLPRRVQVTAAADTPCFEVKEGKRRDLAPGEPAMVVLAKKGAPLEASPAAAGVVSGTGAEKDAGEPPKLHTVLRLPGAGGKEPSQEDLKTARILNAAAQGFYQGEVRGGLDPPEKNAPAFTGLVTEVDPLGLRTEKKKLLFSWSGDTLVINSRSLAKGALQRDETVLVYAPEGLSPGGALHASVIVRCPAPHLKGAEVRRLIQRDQSRDKR
jgi:hypothetical protein